MLSKIEIAFNHIDGRTSYEGNPYPSHMEQLDVAKKVSEKDVPGVDQKIINQLCLENARCVNMRNRDVHKMARAITQERLLKSVCLGNAMSMCVGSEDRCSRRSRVLDMLHLIKHSHFVGLTTHKYVSLSGEDYADAPEWAATGYLGRCIYPRYRTHILHVLWNNPNLIIKHWSWDFWLAQKLWEL